ncbi:hypothetical protein [Primorskyibacter flagellatus]|uniref:hypothetical protein n=1 Tax=Primorskyibacter flagellatus TaxID=1387277 RepID=UPI003A917B07
MLRTKWLVAPGPDLVNHRLRGLGLQVAYHHSGPGCGECLDDGAAYACPRTGDDGNLPF